MRYRQFAVIPVALILSFTALPQRKTADPKTSKAPSAADDAQQYTSPAFGFRYRVPYGWVDRTKEMRDGNQAGNAEVLLAAFERPPQATGETINSAVVIASESAASYPGLKRAEDYVGPLTELATAKGFKADGEPYALVVESRPLVRADFVKTINENISVHQCTLVMLAKGQIVSFTFIAASDDDLDELMDALHFVAAKPSQR